MTAAQEEQTLFGNYDTSWQEHAACSGVGQEMFFDGRSISGKRYCANCPVKGDCLDWSLLTDQRFGIWGGYSTKERDKRYSQAVREAMREDLN
jgi:WhiB family redox-sensing transcriptional regulator